MAIELGDVHRLTYEHTDPAGANLVSATTMSLTVIQPNGVAVTVTPITPVSVGRYQYDFTTTQAGRHVGRWVGSGTNPGSSPGDVFDVRPADPGYIISLDYAKAAANITTTEHDDELRTMIEATTLEIEDVVGPVVVRPYSEVQDGGPYLVLHNRPVVALTALTPLYTGGPEYVPEDMDIDGPTGIVRHLLGSSINGPLRVTYTAGRSVIPANVVEAAGIIVAHKWGTQRGHGGGRPSFGEDTDVVPTPGLGFLIPRRAMEALAPHQRSRVLVA